METSDLHVSRCQNKKHTDQLEVIHIFLRMRQSHQQFCRAKAQRTPTHTEKLEHSAEGTWTKTMYLRQSSPPGLINNRHNLCRRAQTQIHLNQINWSYTRSKHIKGYIKKIKKITRLFIRTQTHNLHIFRGLDLVLECSQLFLFQIFYFPVYTSPYVLKFCQFEIKLTPSTRQLPFSCVNRKITLVI